MTATTGADMTEKQINALIEKLRNAGQRSHFGLTALASEAANALALLARQPAAIDKQCTCKGVLGHSRQCAIFDESMMSIAAPLAKEASKPAATQCVHVNDPKGCYRVRCQLGNKCVDDDMSPRPAAPSVEQDERGVFAEYRRGVKEAFHIANMIHANRQGRTAEETCSSIVRVLAEMVNSGEARAASTSANVAQGWKLVPVEPTDEMKKAGTQYAECAVPANAVFAYRAMLAAAPIAPSANVAQGADAVYQIRTLRAGSPAWIDADKATAEHLQNNGAHELRIVYTAPPAQTALTDEQREDLQEAREILENMVRSVELDGNYSTEATCTFLRQALLCIPKLGAGDAALTAAKSGDTK